MNLVLHQFRKDVRQYRVLLGIWFGLLLLNLAVNLGWAGQVSYTAGHGFDRAANTWTGLLPVILWMFVGVLPSLVVLTDSPARREGFLATRPLPKRDLFLAKLLFILALIVVPWTLLEWIHLAGSGMPGWVVARGTLERLMVTLPVAVGFGTYATLWPGIARWARALGATVVGGYVLILITAVVTIYIFHGREFSTGSNLANEIAGLYELVLALVVLAVWHARAHRGILARWGALALVAVSYYLTMTYWPWNCFALRPENQPAAVSALATAGLDITPRQIFLQKVEATDNAAQPNFNLNFVPKTSSLPARDLVDWSARDARLMRADGRELRCDKPGHGPIFSGNYWNPTFNTADFLAWAVEFPTNILFLQRNSYVNNTMVNYNHFRLPTERKELTAPLTLSAAFEARVFQWRKLADLPLTAGATATDDFGAWKLVAVTPSVPYEAGLGLFFERRQIELSTVADSRCSTVENGVFARMSFMIFDPVRNVAWLPEQNAFTSVTRGTDTALAHYFSTITFPLDVQFNPAEIARSRLIIFEKSWLGSVPETWSSPAFTIDEKLTPFNPYYNNNQDPMPRPEFNRRVAALKMPGPGASRQEVSLYLLEFLRLVDAQGFSLSGQDPCTRQLATLIPAHLDILLGGLPAMSSASRQTVINAIQFGAMDAQKPIILEALLKEPDLAQVVIARGWLDDASTEIYQLAQSSRRLPHSALQAIAWFHDPQTYPRLLEEFAASPSLGTEAVLSSLPGLAPQIDAIVARQWHEESLGHSQHASLMFGELFQLAMRHGQTSALARVYLVLDNPDFMKDTPDYSLARVLWDTVQMPDAKPGERNHSESAIAWMRKHRPEDFVFNPALRQFVLKSSLSAGSTISASNP